MRKVIVSGANGFVGSSLCRRLCLDGVQVIALVRSKSSNIDSLSGLTNLRIEYVDMKDYADLHRLIQDEDVDCFYHFAWNGCSGALRGDANVQLGNVRGTCDAIRAAGRIGCKRFVFAASIMEYEIQKTIYRETDLDKTSLYPIAKQTANYMAKAMASDLGIDYMAGVISNIYGPGEVSPRLVNTTIRKLLHGEHCSFSPGEQLYDFIYIDDAVEAFLCIGEKGVSLRQYYIGSGCPRPLNEFLTGIRDVIAPDAVIGLGELPYHGISLSYEEFDREALTRDTGFSARTDFKSGIRKTGQWIKDCEGYGDRISI